MPLWRDKKSKAISRDRPSPKLCLCPSPSLVAFSLGMLSFCLFYFSLCVSLCISIFFFCSHSLHVFPSMYLSIFSFFLSLHLYLYTAMLLLTWSRQTIEKMAEGTMWIRVNRKCSTPFQITFHVFDCFEVCGQQQSNTITTQTSSVSYLIFLEEFAGAEPHVTLHYLFTSSMALLRTTIIIIIITIIILYHHDHDHDDHHDHHHLHVHCWRSFCSGGIQGFVFVVNASPSWSREQPNKPLCIQIEIQKPQRQC